MKFILVFLAMILLSWAEDFISGSEYAKMLYQNPRGISCNKCHGNKGEGAIIAKYKSFDKRENKMVEKSLKAPKINDLDYDEFSRALSDSKGMMPTYFLTQSEIRSLYEYVQSFNKKDKK